jgi:hypothetical protein
MDSEKSSAANIGSLGRDLTKRPKPFGNAMSTSTLSAYHGKRLLFWASTGDEEVQRVGTLSATNDALRLEWVEVVPGRAVLTYHRTLHPRIVSVLDPAPDGSGAGFECFEVLAIRRPRQ